MLKSYGNKNGRSKLLSYKPLFHTYPISYVQYLLYINISFTQIFKMENNTMINHQ